MDLASYLKFMLALVLVLSLFGALAWAAKRFLPSARTGPRPGRRLAVIEVAVLDARRRLLLIRRDDVEHLILLGGTTETVIERDIRSPPTFAEHLSQPREPS